MTDEFEDEFSDEEEGDEFSDFMAGLRPGTKVSAGGLIRYREGGDAEDWSYPGATKRVPVNYMIQIGVIDETAGAAVNGMIEVTFPQAFTDPPWVMACVVNTIPFNTPTKIMAAVSSAAGMELYWNSAPISATYMAISWMAIGPVGTA